MRRIGLVLLSVPWFAAVLATAAYVMMGDPVEGHEGEQVLLGRVVIAVGAGLWFVAYWLTPKKQEH